ADRELEEKIVDEAIEASTLDLPEKLIDYQAQRSWDRVSHDLDSSGLSVEQYLRIRGMDADAMRAELRAAAERSLRRELVLRRIAEHEGLQVTDEDIDEVIRSALSSEGGDPKAEARALRSSEIR